jgi:hypothetical protein
MKCSQCANAVLSAKAPTVGNYYTCPFDKQGHRGDQECTADKKSNLKNHSTSFLN